MNPEKTPSPDGTTAQFYQRFWPTVKRDLDKDKSLKVEISGGEFGF